MSLATIVRALGGDLWAGGRRANVPAPGHSAADRSVSLLLDGDRVVAHGFGGVAWREVLADLVARRLIDVDGRLLGGGALPPPSPAPGWTTAARRRAAMDLWDGAAAVRGTLSARHLRRRGVIRAPSPALRHHSAVPAAVYEGRGPYGPALLASVSAPDGALCAVEITYLAADGARARRRLARKTVGVLPPGCAVRLDPAGRELLVAEGVFTALSASAWFGLPAWALLSTSNLRAWAAPPGVRRVLIAADRGRDGERSAGILSACLKDQGVASRVRLPPWPFGDWNEALASDREEGGRDARGEPDGREVRTGGSECTS